jgi:hypothetical protein
MEVQKLDPLEHTAVSALKFIDTYSRENHRFVDRGLEYLANFSKPPQKTIDDYLATDEFLDKKLVAAPSRNLLNKFRNDVIPKSLRGLRSLENSGFALPLNYLSDSFRAISVLAFVVQISGAMDCNYSINFHSRKVSDGNYSRVIGRLAQFSQVHYPQNDVSQLAEGGLPMGRVLSQLGVNQAGQKKSGIHLPSHLLNLSTWYRFGQTKHIGPAKEILVDAVAVLLHETLKPNDRILRLPAQVSVASAQSLGTEVVYMLQSLFPDDHFGFTTPSRMSADLNMKCVKLYTPSIYLPARTFEKIMFAL